MYPVFCCISVLCQLAVLIWPVFLDSVPKLSLLSVIICQLLHMNDQNWKTIDLNTMSSSFKSSQGTCTMLGFKPEVCVLNALAKQLDWFSSCINTYYLRNVSVWRTFILFILLNMFFSDLWTSHYSPLYLCTTVLYHIFWQSGKTMVYLDIVIDK